MNGFVKRSAWALLSLSMAAGSALHPALAVTAVDRSKPPALGPVRPYSLPPVSKLTLTNGLSVFVVESHKVPVVSVLLLVRSGSAADPREHPGLAAMTAQMLDEGAGGKDSLALDDALSFLGAELKAASTWDSSIVQMQVPVVRLEAALALMADVALRPDFPPGELERIRKESLTDLLEARSEPTRIASRAFAKALFGEAHRYGLPATGDLRSISTIQVADLRAFHSGHFRPNNATLILAGDVQASSLQTMLEKQFGKWSGAGSAPAALAVPPQVKGRRIWLVDKPGAAQSVIRIGRVGPNRQAPQYHALEVMNTLLGGSFTSRLNHNLREVHGYAYGARSGFDLRRTGGVFVAAADVQTKSTAEAMAEFMKELERIKTPATPLEIERARNFLALRFAEEFETTGQIAGKLAERESYSLPADTFDTYVVKAIAVSGADVLRVAREQVDTANVVIVIVGDRAVIEKPLRALNLGEIRILTVEDVMGPAPKL